MKTKRKADEENLGSEPPIEDEQKRKRKRPSREKHDADKVAKRLQGQNGNKIPQVAETTHKDGDVDVSKGTITGKRKKDKVTNKVAVVQVEIREQEEAGLKAGCTEQPKKCTKKSKEDQNGGDGDLLSLHGKGKRKLVGKDKSFPEAEQYHVSSENPDINDKKQLKNKKRKRDQLEKDHQNKDRTLKGDFPDPAEDGNLSEPAIKALSYVYSRTVSDPEWKFNKARQNWIIRHLWDTQTIPEKYFASCLKYIEGIQGNTRDVISESVLSLLGGGSKKDLQSGTTDRSDSKKAATSSGNTTVTVEDPAEKATLTKMERAREVLACLGLTVPT